MLTEQYSVRTSGIVLWTLYSHADTVHTGTQGRPCDTPYNFVLEPIAHSTQPRAGFLDKINLYKLETREDHCKTEHVVCILKLC